MIPLRRVLLVALALGATCVADVARAHEFYVTRVPNTATATNTEGMERPCITCHNNPDGGAGCGTRPCLNPFGLSFRDDYGLMWGPGVAMADADGDGFTNGQELQEPTGTWRPGFDAPGVPEYVTRPGFPEFNPGTHDDDGDGYCWFGRDMNDDGDCTDPGENDGSLDCDDAMSAVNSGATELCTNTFDDDCNGLDTLEDPVCEDVVDRDGDGFCTVGADTNGDRDCIDAGESDGESDCDDTRVTVFPGNRENCADLLDNDCNELVDDEDPACRGDIDMDMDGFCPIGRDFNDDGDCLDTGEPAGGFDCDDTNPDANPDQEEICTDTIDNDCDGGADFGDDECRGFFDGDRDGYCATGIDMNDDGDCADEGEIGSIVDCNDEDPTVHPGAAEMCTNGGDDDCDDDVDLADADCAGYLDTDGDRYCFVGFDENRDGDCADEGEMGLPGVGTDCNDDDPLVFPDAIDECTDGVDNNCDGSTDAYDPNCSMDYLDHDGDGWCEVGEDVSGDGDCSDAGEQGGPADAAPFDSTVFPGAPENCLDRKDNDQDGVIDDPDECTFDTDADGDGFCALGRDLNGDGDCLDEGENAGVTDCDDSDPERNPDAEELCQNRLDEDCDGDVDLLDTDCFHLLDRDGDGICGLGIDDNGDGDCLDEAEDRFGEDCDDTRDDVFPGASELCDDGIDNDCDGDIDAFDPACPCDEDLQCDDGNPCTVDRCGAEGICQRTDICADGGTGDGGMTPGGDGGCGCASSGTPGGAFAVLLVLAAALRRRRR